MYRRIILKLSGEALAGEGQKDFDNTVIDNIIEQIKILLKKNIQVSIVVGGGNFWRGRSADSSMDRTKADQIGMLATVMNAIYLADSFRQKSIEAIVMTPFIIGTITEQFSKQKAMDYLNSGKIAIFAGGIGHPFFSTDTITALRASELDADALLFAKNIDGVYNKDPNIYSDAVKYEKIKCIDIIEKNLKVIDISAANLCYEQSIPVVIFGLNEKDGIIKAASGEKIGTLVTI